jgi:SSS family solute:Na+ symporter
MEVGNMTPVYWIAVIVYSLAMMLVGWKLKKSGSHTQLNFWLAERKITGLRLGVSLSSGWLMLGWIGFGMSQIYMFGASGLWLLPIPWVVLTLIIVAAVPLYRRIPSVSLPQAIEKRFGSSARAFLAILSFGVFLSWTQAELFMAGTLVSPFLNTPNWLTMLIIVIPILFYTWYGGFKAIVITDVLQFVIMAVFMVILAYAGYTAAVNSTDLPLGDALAQVSPPWSATGEAGNLWFLGFLFPVVLLIGYLPGWLLEQDLVVRMQAAPSTKEARKGAWLAVLLISLFVCLLPALAAFYSLVAFPPVDGMPAAAVGPSALGIITALITTLPDWVSVFMLVGLIACQMSTIDTFSNVTAMPIAHDIVEPKLKRAGVSAEKRYLSSRLISMGAIVLALLCAMASESLGDVYYISSGVLSACIAVPFLFAFWKRTTLAGVMVASVMGFLGTIGGYFWEYYTISANYTEVLPGWLQNSYGYNYLAFGVLLSVVSIIVVSLLTKPSSEKRLASVSHSPVDDYEVFSRNAETW